LINRVSALFLDYVLALKRAVCFVCFAANLTSESVQGTSLSLESIDDVHGGDGLPLGVFGVGNSVTDNVLEENLKNTSGFFVDEAGDTLRHHHDGPDA